jgi:DNA-binding transcriptional regulator YhcF (GntR family)
MTNFDRNVPIYLQIVENITKKILSGEYSPGEKLPSVRDIAAAEGINPNTAQRALSSLETDMLVVTERTSGRFVTEDATLIEKKREEAAMKLTNEFIKNMKEIGYPEEKLTSLLIGGNKKK